MWSSVALSGHMQSLLGISLVSSMCIFIGVMWWRQLFQLLQGCIE